VPEALTAHDIEQISQDDEEITQLRYAIRKGTSFENLPNYKHVKDELSVLGKLVLRGTRIVIPASLRKKLLKLAHEGHQGIVKTKQRLRDIVWWPGIEKMSKEK
jgi:hypothetical protein